MFEVVVFKDVVVECVNCRYFEKVIVEVFDGFCFCGVGVCQSWVKVRECVFEFDDG